MIHDRRGKNTEPLRVHLDETLKADLMAAAGRAGFDALSPFVRHILDRWAYGNSVREADLFKETVRDE